MSAERLLAIAATVVIIAAVIAGIVLTEGPGTARAERFDQERLNNLSALAQLINDHFNSHDVLPETIGAFSDDASYERISTDPRTNAPYPYTILSETSYRLCATFETNGPHEFGIYGRIAWDLAATPPTVEPRTIEGSGEQCFVISITKP